LYNTSTDFWDFPNSKALAKSYDTFERISTQFPLDVDYEETFEDGLVDIVYNTPSPIKKMKVLKVFPSGHKPCLCEFTYEDDAYPPQKIVFKTDDVRPDLMVETMFEVFNRIWKNAGIINKTHLLTFKVIPGGDKYGLIEFVENSRSMRDFNLDLLDNFSDDEEDEFISTSSAGYVGAYLLGIRDRHKDNLMIKDDYKFFQLDFKHAFNFKTFGIDSCRFAIPTGFKNKLVNRGKWENFKNRCAAAHLVLRRHATVIVQLSRYLFNGLFDRDAIEKELLDSFYLDRTEEQAAQQIKKLIESGVTSLKRIFKNTTHELSGNIKPKVQDPEKN